MQVIGKEQEKLKRYCFKRIFLTEPNQLKANDMNAIMRASATQKPVWRTGTEIKETQPCHFICTVNLYPFPLSNCPPSDNWVTMTATAANQPLSHFDT